MSRKFDHYFLLPTALVLLLFISVPTKAQVDFEPLMRPMIDNLIDIVFVGDFENGNTPIVTTSGLANETDEGNTPILNNNEAEEIEEHPKDKTPLVTIINSTDDVNIDVEENVWDTTPINYPWINNQHVITSFPNLIHVYPNPATDGFQVRLTTEGEGVLSMHSITGQLLYQQTFVGVVDTRINTHELPSGIYILHVQVNNKMFTKQVQIQH